MKKVYIAPISEVIQISVSTILAGSPGSISDTEAPVGESGNPANFSRGGRGFGDDE